MSTYEDKLKERLASVVGQQLKESTLGVQPKKDATISGEIAQAVMDEFQLRSWPVEYERFRFRLKGKRPMQAVGTRCNADDTWVRVFDGDSLVLAVSARDVDEIVREVLEPQRPVP